jgi:2-methylcitrate dehydratase PrpD
MTTIDITGQLAAYMAQARNMQLAPHVAQEAKHRVLDALAAIVSGSHLPAGEMAIHFARAQGGVAEATVLATDIRMQQAASDALRCRLASTTSGAQA